MRWVVPTLLAPKKNIKLFFIILYVTYFASVFFLIKEMEHAWELRATRHMSRFPVPLFICRHEKGAYLTPCDLVPFTYCVTPIPEQTLHKYPSIIQRIIVYYQNYS